MSFFFNPFFNLDLKSHEVEEGCEAEFMRTKEITAAVLRESNCTLRTAQCTLLKKRIRKEASRHLSFPFQPPLITVATWIFPAHLGTFLSEKDFPTRAKPESKHYANY